MKTFDEEDKKVVELILESKGFQRSLNNIIFQLCDLEYVRINIDKETMEVKFLLESENVNPTEEEFERGIIKKELIIEQIIRIIALLKYLEKEELVILFDSVKSTENPIKLGLGASNMPYFTMKVEDQKIIEMLVKYIYK